MSKSARKESKNASHLSHFIARHVLDKMPQRTTRVPDVASMPERAPPPLLLALAPPRPVVEVEKHPSAFLIHLHPRLALSLALWPLQSRATMAGRHASGVSVAKPPRASSRRAEWSYGCGEVSWCSPTPPSPPAWPSLARKRKAGDPPPFSVRNREKKGPRVRIRNNPGFQMRSQDSYE
jgi:hypothetical protein